MRRPCGTTSPCFRSRDRTEAASIGKSRVVAQVVKADDAAGAQGPLAWRDDASFCGAPHLLDAALYLLLDLFDLRPRVLDVFFLPVDHCGPSGDCVGAALTPSSYAYHTQQRGASRRGPGSQPCGGLIAAHVAGMEVSWRLL